MRKTRVNLSTIVPVAARQCVFAAPGWTNPRDRLERILFKWEQFDGTEKHAKQDLANQLMIDEKLQSFQLGLLRPGHRRAALTVPAPRRATLLAGAQKSRRSNDSI